MNLDSILHRIKRFSLQTKSYGFSGNYSTWQEALSKTKSYHDDTIFNKVLSSTKKVASGEACFERDAVAFYEPEYNWFILGCLNYVYHTQKTLNVADFGGALGSIYFQHKQQLEIIHPLHWHVIEQSELVKLGKENFESENLSYHNSLKEANQNKPLDIVMFRCVLPYLENPYAILQQTIDLAPAFILIDKNPFIDGPDRICIQKVSKKIVSSSYPAWFFNKKKMMDFMSKHYELVFSDYNQDLVNINASYEGHLFIKKNL